MKREETFADVFPGTIGTVPPTAQETIAAFHGQLGAATPMRAGAARATVPDMVYVTVKFADPQTNAGKHFSTALLTKYQFGILHAALVDIGHSSPNGKFVLVDEYVNDKPIARRWYSLPQLNSVLVRVGMKPLG